MSGLGDIWPEVALGDHIELLAGHPFKSGQYTSESSDVRLLRGDNIGQGFLRWESTKRWDASVYASYRKFHLREGDVILAMDRPWIPAGLKFAWIRQSDLPCLLVQRVARIRGSDSLLTEYVRYLIASPAFTDHVHSIITGVNVPHISGRDISRFRFRLPPAATQQRIASILSAYDDLIENNTRRIAILEEMARRFYEEWFVAFRFPGHGGQKSVETDLRSVPADWPIVRCDQAIAFNPKTKVPREGLMLFAPMAALSESQMTLGSLEKKEGNSGAKFQNGDTLLARITPCLENGKTGFVDILPKEQPAACGSTEFIVMRSLTVCPEFVYLLARSNRFRDVAIKSMSGATGRQRVRSEVLEELPMAQPDRETLERFVAIVRPMFGQINLLNRKNANLRARRDLLLPKLVSGEIDVSRIDEPEAA